LTPARRVVRFKIPRTLPWMKIDEIRQLLHAQPFRPFLIHVADGGRIPVKHMDFVALAPAGREMFVYQPEGSWQIVDVPARHPTASRDQKRRAQIA